MQYSSKLRKDMVGGKKMYNIAIAMRHGEKGPDDMLTTAGIEACIARGESIGKTYAGYDLKAITSPVQRAIDTGKYILQGASIDETVKTEPQLGVSYTKDELAAIKASKEGSLVEKAKKSAPESLYHDAYNLAEVIEETLREINDGKDTVIPIVTHSPTVEYLGYLLSGNDAAVLVDSSYLTGISVKYDGELGIFVATLDYADGRKIISESLTEKCEESREAESEANTSSRQTEEKSGAQAAEE